MTVFSCHVPEARSESLFETAVYRFRELHTAPDDALVSVHTEIRAGGAIKSVRLWSLEAVEQFERYWRTFARERAMCNPFLAS